MGRSRAAWTLTSTGDSAITSIRRTGGRPIADRPGVSTGLHAVLIHFWKCRIEDAAWRASRLPQSQDVAPAMSKDAPIKNTLRAFVQCMILAAVRRARFRFRQVVVHDLRIEGLGKAGLEIVGVAIIDRMERGEIQERRCAK